MSEIPVLKRCFESTMAGGALHFHLERACKIAAACFCLHNFCKRKGVTQENGPWVEDNDNDEEDDHETGYEYEQGRHRQNLINTYFT